MWRKDKNIVENMQREIDELKRKVRELGCEHKNFILDYGINFYGLIWYKKCISCEKIIYFKDEAEYKSAKIESLNEEIKGLKGKDK